ncbi:MAG: amidohydrolase family protein [Pseudomonadota bacterium]
MRLALGTVLASLLMAGCALQPAPTLTIDNVTVIDAVAGATPNRRVVIVGDRIRRVEAAGPEAVRGDVIDGTGKFLIPGLWDMHVHLTYEPRLSKAMPGLFLRHGVTSVRDTGGQLDQLAPIVRSMRADGAVAPRVFFSGPLLDGRDVVYNGAGVPSIGVATPDVATASRRVAELVAAGADFIKIYEMVEPAVFRALAEAARNAGLPIAAHVPLSMTASAAAPFIDSLEHVRNVEFDCAANADELLRERRETLKTMSGQAALAVRSALHRAQRPRALAAYDPDRCAVVIDKLRRVVQVPTMRLNTMFITPPWRRSGWAAALEQLPSAVRAAWEDPPTWFEPDDSKRDTSLSTFTLDIVAAMAAADVPIGAGTDTPIGRAIPGYSLHNELVVMVEAGMSAQQALEAATVVPARFFGLSDEAGTVERGKWADLVLLDADPLIDIANTQRISEVVFRGRRLSAAR